MDALAAGVYKKKVNWVLDADIRDFFTSLDRGWMETFLGHRIADKRVLRLIGKWLAAGVVEDGNWSQTVQGSPQGASVSPLLANVYLHYVFDQWAEWWRRRHARGDVIIVRFADDFIVGFEHQGDAKQFLQDLRERFAKFSLELHPGKTRLIEFGRFAAERRAARGLGKPETFDFLGFTHICGKRQRAASGSGASRSRSGCGRSYARSTTSSSDVGTSPSRSKDGGWAAWCEVTSPTTPCPATSEPSDPYGHR